MSSALLIAEVKVVEFRRTLCPCQPIRNERGLTPCQDFGHALPVRRSWSSARNRSGVRDWYSDWNSHFKHRPLVATTDNTIDQQSIPEMVNYDHEHWIMLIDHLRASARASLRCRSHRFRSHRQRAGGPGPAKVNSGI